MMHVDVATLATLTPAKIKARALEAFEEACRAPDGVDWHGLTTLMHAALTAKPKRKGSDDTPEWWHCYDYGKKAVRVSIEVQFSDGRTVRASVNSDPGKPFNLGRGLLIAVAFYRQRIFKLLGCPEMTRRTYAPDGRELPAWDAHLEVPPLYSVRRLDTGESFDAAECSRLTAEWRSGTWRLSDAMLEAHRLDLPQAGYPDRCTPYSGAETYWGHVAASFKTAWYEFAGMVDDATFLQQKHAAEIAAFEASLEACEDIGETILAEETAMEPDSEPVEPVQPVRHPSPILRRLSASLASSVHPWPSLPVKPAFPIVRIAA